MSYNALRQKRGGHIERVRLETLRRRTPTYLVPALITRVSLLSEIEGNHRRCAVDRCSRCVTWNVHVDCGLIERKIRVNSTYLRLLLQSFQKVVNVIAGT